MLSVLIDINLQFDRHLTDTTIKLGQAYTVVAGPYNECMLPSSTLHARGKQSKGAAVQQQKICTYTTTRLQVIRHSRLASFT